MMLKGGIIKLVTKHYIKNIEQMNCNGLHVTINAMDINIGGGTFNRKDISLNIMDTKVTFEVLNQDRVVRIYLINDNENPIIATEEVGKTDYEVNSPLACIASFDIPANCNDLSTVPMQVWEFTDEEVAADEGDPEATEAPKVE